MPEDHDLTICEVCAQPATDVTVLEGGPQTEVTVREGSAARGLHLNLVPGGVFLSYQLVKPLEVTSGEADLWFIEQGGTQYVLKLYRYGIKPKADLTAKLQALAAEHVVKVAEHGVFGNRAYEVLEKIAHGDLRKLSKPCPEGRLMEVLRELSAAVSHLHEEGIIHRDLKPANVLMRTMEPLDLVLTDFGIASLSAATMHLTNANRTASYSAPEALTGVVSKASDWWSVGVMVLELLRGVHPFLGQNEQVINFQLVSKGIQLPKDLSPAWSELLRGLLTRDHEQRWGAEQVRNWLSGQRNQATYYEGDRKEAHSHKPYQFDGKEIYTAKELAFALSENWDAGVKNFGRGFVSGWVDKQLGNQDLASRLMDIHEDQSLSPDEKLTLALLEMNGELPGIWKGNVVNREWAAREPEEFKYLLKAKICARLEKRLGWPEELAAKLEKLKQKTLSPDIHEALEQVLITGGQLLISGKEVNATLLANNIGLLEGALPAALQELTGQNWLLHAADNWKKYWPRVDALGCGTTKAAALPWILDDRDNLTARAGELLLKYVGSTNPKLDELWRKSDWGTAECIAVCAADESELKTVSFQLYEKLSDQFTARLPTEVFAATFAKLKALAEQGQSDGQFYMGLVYDDGCGVIMDKKLAVDWFRLAAEQGHAKAQFQLGMHYAKGLGVSRDLGKAGKWFRLAARQQLPEAVGHLENLEKTFWSYRKLISEKKLPTIAKIISMFEDRLLSCVKLHKNESVEQAGRAGVSDQKQLTPLAMLIWMVLTASGIYYLMQSVVLRIYAGRDEIETLYYHSKIALIKAVVLVALSVFKYFKMRQADEQMRFQIDLLLAKIVVAYVIIPGVIWLVIPVLSYINTVLSNVLFVAIVIQYLVANARTFRV